MKDLVHKVDWNSLAWTQVRPGVERKAYSSKNVTLALNRLQHGHEPKPHSHPNEQVVYIMTGEIDFHVDDQVVRLGPGEMITVPPNAVHFGVVVSQESVLNLDVFTPARQEYAESA